MDQHHYAPLPKVQTPTIPHGVATGDTNVNVVVNAQPAPLPARRPWAHGLCSCCDDCAVCEYFSVF